MSDLEWWTISNNTKLKSILIKSRILSTLKRSERLRRNTERKPSPTHYRPDQWGREAPRQQSIQTTFTPAQLFHFVSIIFVLLSFVLSPLMALVPVILFCFMQQDLRQNNDKILHIIDFVLTIVVTLCWVAVIVVLAVFTFGIGAILLVFIIPLFILCVQLSALSACGCCGTQPQVNV